MEFHLILSLRTVLVDWTLTGRSRLPVDVSQIMQRGDQETARHYDDGTASSATLILFADLRNLPWP